ncbi:Unspecific monooxygenase [[Leptolyngbya] sp. PCC 7376]|uniref:cytochrome P450 n=1 Tax=[Leptolyngbya] sp. PCC 7376 TaxID=111781 RepID=UPI00029EF7D1|nr:cytochrome P450 [[Leptolyngbya] sp. PCC 7376]AFY38256.1 Unspecific monooxygenase [[Leptolyngbya] sp. PCC 7376]
MAIATDLSKTIPMLPQPKLLQKFRVILNPTGYLQEVLDYAPDLGYMPSAGYEQPLILVHHPQALKEMLVDNRKVFTAPGELNSIIEPLTGAHSLLSLSGDRHRRARKLIMPSFHGERMYNYGTLIQQIIREEVERLPINQPFLAVELTQRITLRTIIEVVFGIRSGDRYEPIIELTRGILNRFQSPAATSFLFFSSLQKDLGAWSPWGNFVRARDALDELIYAEISDRQANPDPTRTDILSLLIQARDEDGEAMTPLELRDELMVLLFAGHETTAISMAWSLYWMHVQPDILQKVRDELEALGDRPDPMTVYRLPYVAAVGNESLRINPVAMFTFARLATQTTQLLDYEIPADSILMGCVYTLHQRPDIYPNPREFRPERFLDKTFTPYEFMPFGGGDRRCVGEALAQFELRLGIASFATLGKFELLETEPVIAQRKGLVLSPKNGIKMQFLGT